MKVLGIDPGFGRCGFGIIDYLPQKYIIQTYGCIETTPKDDYQKRIHILHTSLMDIIKTHKPDHAFVEDLFFSNNAKTAFKVGQARGVILLTLVQNNIPVFEITPLQVKQAVTGYGKADKKQIQHMVKLILKMKEIPKPDDASDALACAIAGCHHLSTLNLQKKRSL